MVGMDVQESSHLKEELVCATDKRFWAISTTVLFKNTKKLKELKNQAVLNSKQYF